MAGGQVEKRGEAGKLSAEERKQLDITYAKTFSFWLDIKIIFLTIKKVFIREGINMEGSATTEPFNGHN